MQKRFVDSNRSSDLDLLARISSLQNLLFYVQILYMLCFCSMLNAWVGFLVERQLGLHPKDTY